MSKEEEINLYDGINKLVVSENLAKIDARVEREVYEFASAMRQKLMSKVHRVGSTRGNLPTEALLGLLKAEIIEFEVALEHMSSDEAAKEAIDIANYAMLMWKRLTHVSNRMSEC